MKIIQKLLEVNLTEKKVGKLEPMTGVFQWGTDKSSERIQVVVSISPLLAFRIQNRTKKEKLPINVDYVGHEFVTALTSPKYADSPFRLVEFRPTEESDVPVNFRLECVDEQSKAIFNEDLGIVIGYKNFRRSAANYIRYEVMKFSKKFEELEEGTRIALPNLKKITV